MIAKPLPMPDKDSAPYWEGLAAGELRVQRCSGCGTLRWPARAICNRCYSFDADWVAMSGRGTIKSWIRTHQRFHPAFAEDLPYVTLLVAIEEQADIQIIGALADPVADPATGASVRAVFKDPQESAPILFWELDAP
jgi:uncharacterized OB-fold protein